MLNVLIVDDEPLARQELRLALSRATDIHVQGECSNAIEAIGAINRGKPDVVFLDIQMPRVTGMEMLSMLDHATMPRVVFLTAYDEYAVQAFEQNAFDYLLKPITDGRLETTLERLRTDRSPPKMDALPEANKLRQIPCFGQHLVLLLKTAEVEYAGSKATGVYVVDIDGQEYPTELSLNILEQRTQLLRCHRQFLVNVDFVNKMHLLENGFAEFVTQGGRVVPVSRRFLPHVKERLGIN